MPNSQRFRQGTRNKLNVYDGDRSICQCHCDTDAAMVVRALNQAMASQPPVENREVTKEEMRRVQAAVSTTPVGSDFAIG